MPEHREQEVTTERPLDKFHEIEMGKVFDAILSIQNQRIQFGTFFGTANLAVLSIAFSTQKAGLLFFGSALFWILAVIDIIRRRERVMLYFRGLQLQEQFAPNDSDTYLTLLSSKRLESSIRQVASISDREQRTKALLSLPFRKPSSFGGFWLPVGASLIEIAAGLVLWLIFSWSLF